MKYYVRVNSDKGRREMKKGGNEWISIDLYSGNGWLGRVTVDHRGLSFSKGSPPATLKHDQEED